MRLPIRKFATIAAAVMLFAVLCPAKTKKHTAAHPSASHSSKAGQHSSTKHRHSARVKRGAWKRHGQQSIQSDRVMAIQQALIREKYLDGQPTGKWDDRTQNAMVRYQADNRWQSKVTPDSRALIKLGLGPDHTTDKSLLDMRSTDAVASSATSTSRGTPNR